MNKVVIITAHPKTGEIFTQSFNDDGTPKLDKHNKPYGTLRAENPAEADLSFAYGSGMKRGQSALIPMAVETWEKVSKARGADGQLIYRDGAPVKGNVVVLETTDQELAKKEYYAPKMAGSGENAKPCLKGGKQIYRKTVFDGTLKLEDVLVQHDNDLSVKAPVATAVEAINQ